MIAISFDESNTYLDKPKNIQCEPLSIFKGTIKFDNLECPVIISCWKLTKEEFEEINKTGRVWLIVLSSRMPPVMLEVEKPFK